MGNQGESCAIEEYHAAEGNSGCDGEADESRT